MTEQRKYSVAEIDAMREALRVSLIDDLLEQLND
jgi:hypothetical protein